MENLLAEHPLTPAVLFMGALYLLMILLGIVCLTQLIIQQKRQPMDPTALNDRLARRAWSSYETLFFFLLFFLLQIFASGLTRLFFYEDQLPVVRPIMTLFFWAALLGAASWIHRRNGASWSSTYGFTIDGLKTLKQAPRLYLAALPLILIAGLITNVIMKWIGHPPEMQDVAQLLLEAPPLQRAGLIAAAVIGAPLVEELFFRGILFPTLLRRFGLAVAILITSIFFSLMHQHAESFLALALLSACFCLAYWRYGSLWVNIGMHALFNAVNIMLMFKFSTLTEF